METQGPQAAGGTRNGWRSWLSLVLLVISTIFAITGPLPGWPLGPAPSRLNRLLSAVTQFLASYGLYIAVCFAGLLGYLQRRRLVVAAMWVYRYGYMAPLTFLLWPVVRQLVSQSGSSGETSGQPANLRDAWSGWEILGGTRENWTVGTDSAKGLSEGHILRTERLSEACTLEFDAVLLANQGSDEIDLIISNVMVLYYSEGVRLDSMTPTFVHRPRLQMLGQAERPRIGASYHFTVEKKGNQCTLDIDGHRFPAFDCLRGQNPAGPDRFGFCH